MTVESRSSALLAYPISLLNAVISPSTRQNAYDAVIAFTKEQPLLASFIAPHILLSFLPLAIFLSFAIGTIVLALVAALLFILFWVGIALLVLLPILFLTVGLGVGVWVWGFASWVVWRWAWGLVKGRGDEARSIKGEKLANGEKR